jgi:hypothetical protein
MSTQGGDRGRKAEEGGQIDLGVEMKGWRRKFGHVFAARLIMK